MGIIVAVKKNGKHCIASDSWSLDRGHLNAEFYVGGGAIINYADNLIGIESHLSFHTAFQAALKAFSKKKELSLRSRTEIFESFCELHESLREYFFMNTQYQDEQTFEWMPATFLIANKHGIFIVDRERAVIELSMYGAIGSDAQYALGAMHACYNEIEDAEEIIRKALRAAKDLGDKSFSSSLPFIHALSVDDKARSSKAVALRPKKTTRD
jgi:ATP-dependent HslUV protease subunit HslV